MIHYGVEGSDPPCEHVDCPGENAEMRNIYAGSAIRVKKREGDLILCFYGLGNHPAVQANLDLKVIEPSIGYDVASVFAPFRAFTSYAQQHMFYGRNNMLMNPSWFDAVIPNAFDVDEFSFQSKKQDYLLCFGRVIASKGILLAIELAQKTGYKLIIAGPGSLEHVGIEKVPDFVEMRGMCNAQQRQDLMSNAKALLAPTLYVEPFGNMVVEAQLSGTPTITTDWGAFSETNPHGVTGYRCRDWNDFYHAVKNINRIDPKICRDWAAANYNLDIVHDMFDRYIQKIIKSDFYYSPRY